jgi:predicted Zn-dependent protease
MKEDEVQSQPALAPFNPATTPVRWSTNSIGTGLNVKLSTSFTDTYAGGDIDADGRNPLEQMMHQWNESTSTYNFFKLSASTTANKEYASLSSFKSDGEMGIYRSDSWNPSLSSSALAITQYYGYRRNAGSSAEYVELSHADIILNYEDYNFTLDETDTNFYDFRTVILHELGHFIGLGHATDSSTDAIMLPTLSSSQVKRALSSHDTDNIRGLYNTSSLTSSSNLFMSSLSKNQVDHSSNNNSGEEVRGVIELRSNGDCHHYVNDKLVSTHKAKLK